ncbi:MAG: DNA translocase FtsK 4TM domain-containing protein [Candidatus Dormibacteraeota bacterium]|nr:DNA translocase FtsK 4TM domain-containing protein [Candidatus Dormibacteraeota bacterium]
MRRTTTRSSRHSAHGVRRAASSRSRPTRRKRPTRPHLTPRQGREIAGVLLVLGALLGLLAIASSAGSILTGFREWLLVTFDRAWFVPVAGALAFGAYLLWPKAPRPRPLDIVAGVVAVVALIGLFGLAAGAGGSIGRGVDRIAVQVVGRPGAWALLAAGLLIGLIVTVHFSPGAMLATVARAAQAAFAERNRLQRLVSPPGSTNVSADKSNGVAKSIGASKNDALARSAASFATPPPAVESLRLWEAEEPAKGDAGQAVADREQPPDGPVMHVVAEVEDDVPDIEWKLPSIALLDTVTARRERMADEIKRNVRIIESTLETFGVSCKVVGVNPGPAVTQYELQPGPGVQVKRITALQNDLSLALAAAPLRIEAPIPGKAAVGIEVPNKSASLVTIREVLETAAFREGTHSLALALGNDVSGQSIVADLTRMPHLLIAGATGQGKSVCINALITSLLFQVTPEHMRLLLIDPKRVELTGYNGLPHLALPVLVESHQAAAALRWAVAEMDRRYKMFSAEGVRNIAAYNEKAVQRLARELPYVVIVIDELADLMMVAAGEIEELICRIAQLARAVGIHLVIATQRPSTDIITGLIKANIPSRIAFAVGSQVDSRVILDSGGAEKLLGRGDMLYQPVDAGKPTRIQGAFVSDPEVEAVVSFWRSQGAPRFMEEILEEGAGTEWERGETNERKLDPLFARAARAVAAEGAASVSLVQRKFNVGYSRAGRIVDQLAENHVVGGYQGSKSREVMMNLPDVDDLLERLGIE